MVLGFKGFKPGLIATLGNGSYQYQPGEASKTKKSEMRKRRLPLLSGSA